MNNDLRTLYRQIRETPALAVDLPEESGKGRIVRLDTKTFSLSSWNMTFSRDTFVEGTVSDDMRLLFCTGDGVEWATERGTMRLDRHEACFCRSDGSPEKMCYQRNSPFSFLSVSIPEDRFTGLIGSYIPEPARMTELLAGKRFAISAAIRKSIQDIGPLESIHSGFEMMRLEARLLESLSLCLQAALCAPDNRRPLHPNDLEVLHALDRCDPGARILHERIQTHAVFPTGVRGIVARVCDRGAPPEGRGSPADPQRNHGPGSRGNRGIRETGPVFRGFPEAVRNPAGRIPAPKITTAPLRKKLPDSGHHPTVFGVNQT